MPKEVIFGAGGQYEARVGWTADGGEVQVGIETIDGKSLITELYGDNCRDIGQRVYERVHQLVTSMGQISSDADKDAALEALGRDVLDLVESSQTSPGSPGTAGYSGVWAALDRIRVNQMIRVLRRARDAAFGKDE